MSTISIGNRLLCLSLFMCTTSIGPGATNMLTAAAGASINRLPVLLIPGDIFAKRNVAPVLQQLESPISQDVSVNDCFKPVSKYWDRINRPEQILYALPEVMRVLTSPAETGAVTLAIPQDVQAEANDFPCNFFEKKTWRISRPRPDLNQLDRAVEMIKNSTKPLIICGGGAHYSCALDVLKKFVHNTHIPIAETFAGKGVLRYALDNGDITIHPSKRFVKDGFIFANNPAYDNSNAIWDFPRMYYKPANVDALRNFNQSGGPIYSMSDFKEGGHIFNKVANQEKFKITIDDVTYNQDDFEIVFVDPFYWALADFDGNGEVTGGLLSTSDVLVIFEGLRDNGIVAESDFLGVPILPGFGQNPTSAVNRSFYEMIMQFSAYPSATVFGTDEIISNPSQFSVLIYDGKRDSSFQLTISNLATILSSIAAISNGAICGDGVINITAPMLTSGQIQNFFVVKQ